MEAISRVQASGSDVRMQVTDSRHIDENGNSPVASAGAVSPFQKILSDQVNSANDFQLNSDDLEQQMLTNPENVNVDEVMIASEKARLSVSFLKSISEKAMKAYNDIMTIR